MKHSYNWNIVGHDRVIADLERDLATRNIPNAYLFAGPEGVGKFTVAKTLAHILQCENNFCHACPTCREIDRGCHSDTIEMGNNGESIKIEEIRNVLPSLHMSRNSAYKILLMQDIERMPSEAANAMLKTLEDPPEKVVFLLTTSHLKEIIPTIISRVRIYNFQRLADSQVREYVHGLYPLTEKELLDQVSAFAMGKPGRAASFMQNPALFDDARKMYNDISLFVKAPDRINEFGYIAQMVQRTKEEENNRIIRDFLDIFTAVLRKKLLDTDASDEEVRKKTIALIKEAQRAQDLLKRNVNNRLLLENLMLGLC
jgi:DNA polymerase III subunit gamma/tau